MRKRPIYQCTLHSFLAVTSIVFAPSAFSQTDLTQLSLEELMEVEVTSVSKKAEKRVDAPASIFVITGEDIRRLGATNLPDALRLVPGLHVARVDSSSWAVSSRGFSSLNSAKLLVLIDGRSVYTPLVSGVFWDVQDVVLEDIDRIEVIRGPGASLWGANAMNGVINIITKRAKDTQGTLLSAGGGTFEHVFGTVRYGDKFDENLHYRLYAKYFDRDQGFAQTQTGSPDDWQMGRGGFRLDWKSSENDYLSFRGDLYSGSAGQSEPSIEIIGRPAPPLPLESELSGGNAMILWRRTMGEESDLMIRSYYDYTNRNDPSYTDRLHTYSIDFQHRFPLSLGQELTWGIAYQLMVNENQGKGLLNFDQPRSVDRIISGFIQDEFTLIDPSLRLTVGSKIEQNDFSGFEVQPSARFSWSLLDNHTLWGAVSRAVRVPTRIERDVKIDAADPDTTNPLPRLVGNQDLNSEKMVSYELGYRFPVAQILFVDFATFFNRYTDLFNLELGQSPFSEPDGTVVIPLRNENTMIGNVRGAEVFVSIEPGKESYWNLTAGYSYFKMQLKPLGEDINNTVFFQGATPAHQVQLMATLRFSDQFKITPFFRYIGSLESADTVDRGVDDYATLDLHFAWRLNNETTFSIVGQNLLQPHHLEFPSHLVEVKRSVYGKFTLNL